MIGNFQGEGMPGKMQFGSGWWFNDQKETVWNVDDDQLAQLGLLSRFVGMLTDSRSFLSYTVSRILPPHSVPDDRSSLGGSRRSTGGHQPAGRDGENICFNNARDYSPLN